MRFFPAVPWVVVLALTVVALAMVLWAWKTGRIAAKRKAAIVVLHAAAGLALLLAALNPHLLRGSETARGSHLVLALDASQSVLRAGRDWSEVRSAVSGALRQVVGPLAPAVRHESTASLVAFARGSRVLTSQVPLEELPRTFSQLAAGDLPPGGESDLEAGLRSAAAELERFGRGAVLLVSDGHETRGDARGAARDLARRGFPVHVVALGGQVPEIGLYAADLPPRIEIDTPTWARLQLVNGTKQELPVEIGFHIPGTGAFRQRPTLPGAGWAHLRQELVFDKPGLRSLDVELLGGGNQRQARRLFTYVAAPPRLLVLGDDHAWTRALPSGFRVETASPEALGAGFDPSPYDAVVLNEVRSQRLKPEHIDRLARAVELSGTGALLINGPQPGDPEAQTMLMSYDDTPLEELLPIVNRPRPVLSEPPPRQIVLLIDTSGSMSGWRLVKSKQIAAAVISRLRGIDRLSLMAFTGGAHPLLSDLAMTSSGKRQALRVVSSLRAGGGTDPTAALALIAGKRLLHCGLFMISDGEFAALRLRPDCEATVFAIGKGPGNVPAVLRELAEPFPVPDDSFDPAGVRISYFDPKPRKHRFQDGRYTPIVGIDAFEGGWNLLPASPPPLVGNAVTHARDDAELAAIRPRPRDPVLAFRDAGDGGTVGVFTSRLPASYYGSPDGARAITRWVERVLGQPERDRYAFRLEDRGGALELGVEVLARGGTIPRIERLTARLAVEGTESVAVSLRAEPELVSAFTGFLRLPEGLSQTVTPGRLVIRESGPDALRRPQRVPLLLPGKEMARLRGGEAWSFGVDAGLLRDVAALGGGRLLLPDEEVALLHGAGEAPPARPLWPFLLGAAILLLLAQVLARRAPSRP